MALSDFYLFQKLKSHLVVHSLEAVKALEAVNEYLEDQEKAFYFGGIKSLDRDGLSAFPLREIILKRNRQIFIPS